MSSGSFQPRRFGAHLLVSQLGEDCLGTVYRALHGSDEKRFERLRILQSPELSPPAVFAAIARSGERSARLSHKAIVQHAELSVVDGAPFVAWYEGAGWTLDVVLAKLRAAAMRLPAAYALLIAERVCAALEHAWFSPVEGEPIRHGLPWPGFIAVSNDAEIRLGGFGLAEAILPTLTRGRLARDVAPYAAPEARESGSVGPQCDVYSVGVLLLELLTGRRPSVSPAYAPASDEFPEGVTRLLDSCFAPVEKRATILELHRGLQEQLAAGPAPVSTADLALFLYTLLNPESRAARRGDGDATNPVAGDLVTEEPLDEPPVPEPAFARRRSDGSRPRVQTTGSHREGVSSDPTAVPRPSQPVRFESVPSPIEALSANRPIAVRSGGRWVGGIAYFACAAAIIVGVEALAMHRDRAKGVRAQLLSDASAAAARRDPAAAAAPVAPSDPARPSAGLGSPPEAAIASTAPSDDRPELVPARTVDRPRPQGPPPAASVALVAPARASKTRRSPEDIAASRRAAEDARFRAGWARIEAERREARDLAADTFGAARVAEAEAQKHFAAGDFLSASETFERAVALYRDAENSSRQVRLERLRLSSAS